MPSRSCDGLLPLVAAMLLPGTRALLAGRMVPQAWPESRPDSMTDLGQALTAGPGISLLVLGTYPADFNMIEYAQLLRHYLPQLQAKGVTRTMAVVNGPPSACAKLASLLDLPAEVELFADEAGEAGREFGVSRGWRPDDDGINPYLKLLAMLVGLGAGSTLPSVITGYLGNPRGTHGWITSALAQGQAAGRWPQAALDLEPGTELVVRNAFDELPLVGGWGRRPLELATLRLQTMLGVSLSNWSPLKPTDERCLTQLGGLVAVDADGRVVYEWRDGGICNVCNFEALLEAL